MIIKNANPIFCKPKKTGLQTTLSNSWKTKYIYPDFLFSFFVTKNIAKAASIVRYKTAQAGANIQSGGANNGFIKLSYQVDLNIFILLI